jgi:hypothetical protein
MKMVEIVNLLTSQLKDITFWQGVISTIVIALLGRCIMVIKSKIIMYNKKRFNHTITGYWACYFKTLDGNHDVVEVYHILQREENLKIDIQHYSSDEKNPVSILSGNGTKRETSIAGYYRIMNSSSVVAGILLFKVIQEGSIYHYLDGIAVQNNNNKRNIEGYKGEFLKIPLKLYNTKKLSIIQRIRFKLGRQCFREFDEAKNFYDKEVCMF